jgi:hypothetical protein
MFPGNCSCRIEADCTVASQQVEHSNPQFNQEQVAIALPLQQGQDTILQLQVSAAVQAHFVSVRGDIWLISVPALSLVCCGKLSIVGVWKD